MDDIQRKLALIDEQLAGRRNLHKQMVSTSPLAFIAVGLITGILLQNKFELSLGLWLTLLVLFAIGALVFFALPRFSSNYQLSIINYQFIIAYMALVCFVCLGAIRLVSFYQPRPDDICNLVSNEKELATENTEKKLKMDFRFRGNDRKNNDNNSSANSATSAVKENIRKLVTLRGLIVTDPYINKNRGWQFAKFTYTDPSSSFYLQVKQVKTVDPIRSKSPGTTAASSTRASNGVDGWAKITGTIRVQVAEPVLDLKAGDYVQAYCWLDRFKATTNPGQFDTAKYLARKNVFIAASVKSRDGIKLLKSHPKGIFTKIKAKLREVATQALVGDLSLEDRSRGLLEALLLGYRGNIDSKTYEDFRKTGLLHFISLSGMHLGILIGIIWWLCKTAGLMKPVRAIICIIAIGIFLLIVPPRPPTVRAAIIGWVFCASFLFRRRFNSLNTLSLAAIILLLIRPTQLFEAGWQLSFAAVLGLLLFCHRIHFFLYEKITSSSWFEATPKAKPFFRIVSRPGPYLLRLFSTGLTAWLGGAGILLYHFYTINPLTSIWTVAAFPLVAMILTIGYLKIVLSFVLPTAALGLGVIVTGLADLLIWMVKLIAHLDISQILIGQVPLTPVILYYGFILFAAFAYLRRPLLKRAICAVMALSLIVFLGVVKWQRTYHDNLVLTCLDVGHGQAILAQLPGKTNVLFDAGSLYKSDIGRRIVAPFLDYSGINTIDAIIISHNDVDHINGIPEIVEHYKVRSVYANDAFINHPDPWGTAQCINDCLNENGLKIQALGKTLSLGNGADIKILWPSKQICRNEELNDNDKSMVSLIEFAGTKILLCSDIEKFAQGELLRLNPNLKADVVVVPHHGLAKTAEPDFLERLDPDILICSCSRSQYERTSRASGPVNRDPNKAKSFYTARDGAIIVRIKKDGTTKFEVFVE